MRKLKQEGLFLDDKWGQVGIAAALWGYVAGSVLNHQGFLLVASSIIYLTFLCLRKYGGSGTIILCGRRQNTTALAVDE